MELVILKDIVIIFALSTFVNLIFNRIKIPVIIGYLITGVIAGPHLLGLVHSPEDVKRMADIGVILLMFTIGLEFSLNHLLKIRRIVFVGGFVQLTLTAVTTMLLARFYSMPWSGALFMGFINALSSTAVVLKILQEKSAVTSNTGRTIVGILIFQDIVVVPLMLFTPLLGGGKANIPEELLVLLIKTIGMVLFIYAGNRWLIPKLLHAVAMTRSQELFMMTIILILLSVALLTYSIGMSLAFGAFIAGLMISESEYSHNAFSDLMPFKDVFTSFFFVSVGMLLNLNFLVEHPLLVIVTVIAVIFIKTIVAGFTGFILGHNLSETIVVGLSLAQVGEFSFILAGIGLTYSLLNDYYYQLFLAVAVISMALTPFLIKSSKPIAVLAGLLPLPTFLVNGLYPARELEIAETKNHIVLIGKDSRVINLAAMLRHMGINFISIIFDPALAKKQVDKGYTAIYGDAVDIPTLKKAYVQNAGLIVVSVGDLIGAMAIVDKTRQLNHHAYMLVRTKHVTDIEELYKLGANQVIPEEFETAIDFFERILAKNLVPRIDIENAVAIIREHNYGDFREDNPGKRFSILNDIPNIEISAFNVEKNSALSGKSLIETDLRNKYGLTVLAVKRGNDIIEHPSPSIVFISGDIVYVLGKPELLSSAAALFLSTKSR
jgi:monovalent cation:H+ antiporter-2, CPA2 family